MPELATCEAPFELEPVQSQTELLLAITKQGQAIGALFEQIPTEAFLQPQGDYWSPAEHLRHLVQSVRPLASAMGLPKTALGLRFGHSKKSRDFAGVVELYLKALADGTAQATGPYEPKARGGSHSDSEYHQDTTGKWRAANQALETVITKWDEKHLDRYQLPHPVLGKLTVREMLFFTLYHNQYHARRVWERLPQAS